MAKLWRILKWWWKCLWAGKVVPRVSTKLYSRSYMRHGWAERLRDLDRKVNDLKGTAWRPSTWAQARPLLMERRLMVAKRRSYRWS